MQFMDYAHFNDEDLRELLVDFYKKHDPDELEYLDDVLNLAYELGPAEVDIKLGDLYGETLTEFRGTEGMKGVAPLNAGKETRVVRVCILGAGYAGAACATYLERTLKTRKLLKVKLTVIDQRKGSVHKYAGSRAAALGNSFAYRAVIPNANLVSGGNVINKAVRFVDDNKIIFDDSSELVFDYLVCATGGRFVSPCEPPPSCTQVEDIIKWYCDVSQAINWASDIVVVGGGGIGAELCGEVKSAFKEKNVTFIHRGRQIVENFTPPCNPGFHKKLNKQMDSVGVHVIPSERVTNLDLAEFVDRPFVSGRRKIKLSSGDSLDSDLLLVFGPNQLNNSMYRKSWLNEIGQVAVEPTLQVIGHSNIFAIGDINDIEENKQGYLAQIQGTIAAKNINKLISSSNKTRLSRYKRNKKTTLMVALGRKNGASNLGKMTAGASTTSRLKGKDLFVKVTWELYNQVDGLLPENTTNWKEFVFDGVTAGAESPKMQRVNQTPNVVPPFGVGGGGSPFGGGGGGGGVEEEFPRAARGQIISYGKNIMEFDEIHTDAEASDMQLLEEEREYAEREIRRRRKKKKKRPDGEGRPRKPRGEDGHRDPRDRPGGKKKKKRPPNGHGEPPRRRKQDAQANRLSMLAREIL